MILLLCVLRQALPYAFGKLGLRAKVYATLPVWKMGQMAVYDAYISRTHEVRYWKGCGFGGGGGEGWKRNLCWGLHGESLVVLVCT